MLRAANLDDLAITERAHLARIIVAPERRGRGVGAAFVQVLLAYADSVP